MQLAALDQCLIQSHSQIHWRSGIGKAEEDSPYHHHSDERQGENNERGGEMGGEKDDVDEAVGNLEAPGNLGIRSGYVDQLDCERVGDDDSSCEEACCQLKYKIG